MGVITDGSVSGNLPEAEAFAVNYPGYPSSTARAIDTLGGAEGILKTRSSQSNYLELRFRPEDPYSHPVLGELRLCSGLLLRISKKKGADSKDASIPESIQRHLSKTMPNAESVPPCPESFKDGQKNTPSGIQMVTRNEEKDAQTHDEASSSTQLCAEIVARVPQAYHFDGMADYQYVLAVHADVERRKKRHWTEVETRFEKGGLMDLDQEDLMYLVPPLFSPKDIPENLVLTPSSNLNSKKKQVSVVRNQWEMDIEPCFAIDFDIKVLYLIFFFRCWNLKFTKIPKKINWEDNIPQGTAPWEWQMVMSKLFDERPIWPRRSVRYCLLDNGLKVSDDQLKRLLLRNAYYFSSGPFGLFWIKKGYDPRKDPESRIYQRVDFRIPPQLRTSRETNTVDVSKQEWKDICKFRTFPSKNFTSLQFFELVDDYIQEAIRKPVEQSACTALMLCVTMRFLSICPRDGAKGLLKSVSLRFEKCNRLQVHGTDSRPNEEGHQHVDRDSNKHSSEVAGIRSNDTEIACNDDDGDDVDVDDDDDDDVEAEDEEEECEEYASIPADGGNGNLYLEPSSFQNERVSQQYRIERDWIRPSWVDHASFSLQASYTRKLLLHDPVGENIPNNYLLQLFGSLPLTKDGNYSMAQDANTSDEEYHIYEQESDGDSDN